MPQIEPRMISNQLQSFVFLYTCQSADVMEIIKKSPSKNGRCPYDYQFIRASFFQCVALKERALDLGDKADYFRQNPEFRSTFPVIS